MEVQPAKVWGNLSILLDVYQALAPKEKGNGEDLCSLLGCSYKILCESHKGQESTSFYNICVEINIQWYGQTYPVFEALAQQEKGVTRKNVACLVAPASTLVTTTKPNNKHPIAWDAHSSFWMSIKLKAQEWKGNGGGICGCSCNNSVKATEPKNRHPIRKIVGEP